MTQEGRNAGDGDRSSEAAERHLINSRSITAFFLVVAAAMLALGLGVIFGYPTVAKAEAALILFASAAGVVLARELLWLLPRIQRIKIGEKVDIVMREMETLKEETKYLRDTQMEFAESQGIVQSAAPQASSEGAKK